MVNQIRLSDPKAVPMALFALEVHRGSIPGDPGALAKSDYPLFNTPASQSIKR